MAKRAESARPARPSLSDGQIVLLGALIEYFDVSGNPLGELKKNIYPKWLRLSKPLRKSRRCYGEPPESIPWLTRLRIARLLGGWAKRNRLFATGSSRAARWVIEWAASEFPLNPKWPAVRHNTPWWRRSDSGVNGSNPEDLNAPEPVPIVVTASIPARAKAPEAKKLLLAAWNKARTSRRTKTVGQPGHPKNPDYAKYLALELCRWNRGKIARKFKVRENNVTQGTARAALAAGIQFPHRSDKTPS